MPRISQFPHEDGPQSPIDRILVQTDDGADGFVNITIPLDSVGGKYLFQVGSGEPGQHYHTATLTSKQVEDLFNGPDGEQLQVETTMVEFHTHILTIQVDRPTATLVVVDVQNNHSNFPHEGKVINQGPAGGAEDILLFEAQSDFSVVAGQEAVWNGTTTLEADHSSWDNSNGSIIFNQPGIYEVTVAVQATSVDFYNSVVEWPAGNAEFVLKQHCSNYLDFIPHSVVNTQPTRFHSVYKLNDSSMTPQPFMGTTHVFQVLITSIPFTNASFVNLRTFINGGGDVASGIYHMTVAGTVRYLGEPAI